MMKKLLLSCMALLSMTQLFAWDGTNSQPANGDGSQATPYQITTANELAWIATNIATTKSSAIKLMNDINLSGANWTAIGTSANQFTGTFDGNYHVVKNMTISTLDATNGNGLFGTIGAGATVKNVGVNGFTITSTGVGTGTSGAKLTGGLAGNVIPGAAGTTININSCFTTNGMITLTGLSVASGNFAANVGGFVGQLAVGSGNVNITDCYTTETRIRATLASGVSTSYLTAVSDFVGAQNTATQKFTNCYSADSVSLSNSITAANIKNSYQFCGYVSSWAAANASNCYTARQKGYNSSAVYANAPLAGTTVKDTLSTGLKASTMAATLGTNWIPDNGTSTINAGYPALNWQLGTPAATAATSATTSGFTANWGATTGAASYTLEITTNNDFSTIVQIIPSITSTSQDVTGLSASTNYYYRVRATNAVSGASSANSNTITATTTIATATQQMLNGDLKVVVKNNLLQVENVASYKVFAISGVKVAEVNNNSATTSISLRNGIYIVKSGSLVQKVVVK